MTEKGCTKKSAHISHKLGWDRPQKVMGTGCGLGRRPGGPSPGHDAQSHAHFQCTSTEAIPTRRRTNHSSRRMVGNERKKKVGALAFRGQTGLGFKRPQECAGTRGSHGRHVGRIYPDTPTFRVLFAGCGGGGGAHNPCRTGVPKTGKQRLGTWPLPYPGPQDVEARTVYITPAVSGSPRQGGALWLHNPRRIGSHSGEARRRQRRLVRFRLAGTCSTCNILGFPARPLLLAGNAFQGCLGR